MAKSKQQIFNHIRDIDRIESINFREISPGDLVSFKYRAENLRDKKPFILFLYHDRKNKLVHAVNLNYLSEFRINELFGEMDVTRGGKIKTSSIVDRKTNPTMIENKMKPSKITFSRLEIAGMATKNQETAGKMLYERHIKQFVKRINCYRTYKVDDIQISSFELMWYRWNVSLLRRR